MGCWTGCGVISLSGTILSDIKVLSLRDVCIYGVPRGSVLRPLLFVLYTAELGRIAGEHGVNADFYADELQLYICLLSHSILVIRPSNCWVAWKQ